MLRTMFRLRLVPIAAFAFCLSASSAHAGARVAPTRTDGSQTSPNVRFAVAPAEAKAQLDRLGKAGVKTVADVAAARQDLLRAAVGSARAARLQASCKRLMGRGSVVDGKTPLTVPFIVDPSFIVDPTFRPDAATKKHFEAARRQHGALAKAGVKTYVDLVNADPAVLAKALGRRATEIQQAARRLATSAGIILQKNMIILQEPTPKPRAGQTTQVQKAPAADTSIINPTFRSGIINPTFRTGIINPTFTKANDPNWGRGIIDPTFLTGIINPTFLVDPTILAGSAPTPQR
jgi:hypothetical protein